MPHACSPAGCGGPETGCASTPSSSTRGRTFRSGPSGTTARCRTPSKSRTRSHARSPTRCASRSRLRARWRPRPTPLKTCQPTTLDEFRTNGYSQLEPLPSSHNRLEPRLEELSGDGICAGRQVGDEDPAVDIHDAEHPLAWHAGPTGLLDPELGIGVDGGAQVGGAGPDAKR